MFGWTTWLDGTVDFFLASEASAFELLAAMGMASSIDVAVPMIGDVLTVGEAIDYARVLSDLGRLEAARSIILSALSAAGGVAPLAWVGCLTKRWVS
jgi:hypothetical protein